MAGKGKSQGRAGKGEEMKTGIELIAEERARQKTEHGWTEHHDDRHDDGELALAAACYATPKPLLVHEERQVQANSSRGIGDCYSYDYRPVTGYWDPWPWDEEWDKRGKSTRIRDLQKAGALIAAEIDRLERVKGDG
jgi:hypothetical protein